MPFEILLVEDNPQEARLLEEAFKEAGANKSTLRLMINCRAVLPYLRGEFERPSGYRPDMILLDYRMPLNGGTTLLEIKSEPALQHLFVMVYTGVTDREVISELYRRGANCCFQKPKDLPGYTDFARHVTALLEMLVLPHPARSKKQAWHRLMSKPR